MPSPESAVMQQRDSRETESERTCRTAASPVPIGGKPKRRAATSPYAGRGARNRCSHRTAGRVRGTAAGDFDLAAAALRGERLGCSEQQFTHAFTAVMCADHERGDAPNPHVGVEAGENVHADDADDVLADSATNTASSGRPPTNCRRLRMKLGWLSTRARQQIGDFRGIGVDGAADNRGANHEASPSRATGASLS